jgi:two-component system LytT family response regulator
MAMLQDLLEDHFPEVNIVGMAQTVKESLELLGSNKIDLLFLDIELPDGKGFDILAGIEKTDFGVIITTSYLTYAGCGNISNLVEFLVKPVSLDALKSAMRRYDQQLRIQPNH